MDNQTRLKGGTVFALDPSPMGLVLLGSTICCSMGLDPSCLYCVSRYVESEKIHPNCSSGV